MKKNTKEELFEYLINSDEGAFMWRGEEDFTVLCSLYKFKIKIITLDGECEPSVSYIEPNPVLVRFSDFPEGKVPEMVILHQKDVHYDLIVPEDSVLASTIRGWNRRNRKKSFKRMKKEAFPLKMWKILRQSWIS